MANFINMAGPLLQNVLDPNNMNQPLSSISMPEGTEEQAEDPLMMQLLSQLSPAELFALVQGNISSIQGL